MDATFLLWRFSIVLLGGLLSFSWFAACKPTLPALPALPPLPKRQTQQAPWFRRSFYTVYLAEQGAKDGGDRLRRFIKRFPEVASHTYKQNLILLYSRRQKGLSVGSLERLFILMNHMIAQSIPLPNELTQNRPGERPSFPFKAPDPP